MSTKSDVLIALEKQRPRYISGQELADMLNLSRTSVWKAINALEDDGYVIDAVRNVGYRLADDSDVLSGDGIMSALGGTGLSPKIEILKTVDSTNNYAKKLALNGASDGTLIIAEEQTAGRGRSGKSFFSPGRTGLYMSIILRPEKAAQDDISLVTLAAAVSVCEAISELTGLEPKIKWVNDVYLGGRKICGILSEAGVSLENGNIDYVIVGIGINCTTPEDEFPEELRTVAASLGKSGISRADLAARIYEGVMRYCRQPGESTVIDRYRDLSLMYGKNVEFTYSGEKMSGCALGINDDGSLLVRCPDGTKISLVGGEVSVHGDFSGSPEKDGCII